MREPLSRVYRKIETQIKDWKKKKDKFADDYKLKDFKEMNKSSKELIKTIKEIIKLTAYTEEEKSLKKDFRANPRIRNKVVILQAKLDLIQQAEKEAKLPKFQENIDKAEIIILSILKSMKTLKQKAQQKNKNLNTKKRKLKQKENWEEWKKWVKYQKEKKYEPKSNLNKLKELLKKRVDKNV